MHAWITKHQNLCVDSQNLSCDMRETDMGPFLRSFTNILSCVCSYGVTVITCKSHVRTVDNVHPNIYAECHFHTCVANSECKLSQMGVPTCECKDGYTVDESGICLGELIFSTNVSAILYYGSSINGYHEREREAGERDSLSVQYTCIKPRTREHGHDRVRMGRVRSVGERRSRQPPK